MVGHPLGPDLDRLDAGHELPGRAGHHLRGHAGPRDKSRVARPFRSARALAQPAAAPVAFPVMSTTERENRLARETSPYLRQHARNPVDWYPWGAEALERARAEDRPIFLSIG